MVTKVCKGPQRIAKVNQNTHAGGNRNPPARCPRTIAERAPGPWGTQRCHAWLLNSKNFSPSNTQGQTAGVHTTVMLGPHLLRACYLLALQSNVRENLIQTCGRCRIIIVFCREPKPWAPKVSALSLGSSRNSCAIFLPKARTALHVLPAPPHLTKPPDTTHQYTLISYTRITCLSCGSTLSETLPPRARTFVA